MNAERFRRLADLIEEHNRFNYEDFFTVLNWNADDVYTTEAWKAITETATLSERADKLLHRCDTAGCVAGWATTAATLDGVELLEMGSWSDAGAEYLEITDGQAETLFYAHLRPEWWDGDDVWGMDATAVARMLREIADGKIDLFETLN